MKHGCSRNMVAWSIMNKSNTTVEQCNDRGNGVRMCIDEDVRLVVLYATRG